MEICYDETLIRDFPNGLSGKSTILEAIGALAGFGKLGGSRSHQTLGDDPWEEDSGASLAKFMGASWLPKIPGGWFFKAESFFALSNFLERSAFDARELGPDYLSHSHGEGFMRFFVERSGAKGLFLFDEPESALSPQRQFDFIKHLLEQCEQQNIQAIIATHSPILMGIPGARLVELDRNGLREVALRDTAHFRLYREFFLDPEGTIETMIQE